MDLNAIIAADEARREMRRRIEDATLGIVEIPEGADPYCYSRSIRGVPLSMTRKKQGRQPKASQDSWARGMRGRTVGVAPDADPANSASVKVTRRDGSTEIRSAGSFRSDHISTRNAKHKATQRVDMQNALDARTHRTAYDMGLATNHDQD